MLVHTSELKILFSEILECIKQIYTKENDVDLVIMKEKKETAILQLDRQGNIPGSHRTLSIR